MARTAHLPVAAADGSVALKAGRSASEEVTLTGQLGAVQWNDNGTEIRLYGPDQDLKKVLEYSWQRSDPWVQGETPAECSVTSRVAAVHWHKDDATHLRLYAQDTSNRIVEWCYDTGASWTKGQTVSGAYPGTGIAALALFNPKKDSAHLFLYYQAANNQIIELYWDGDTRSGWVPSHAFQGAAQGTGIAAVYFLDEDNNPHKRLYYQDTTGLIIEQCWDGGEWALGYTFSAAPVGNAIAATHWWRDGSHVRLYYQSSPSEIIEWCYDTGSSWFTGHTFTQVAPGTGIAAVGWDGAANHVRVFYKDAAPYEGSYHAVIEQCYDGGEWHPGTFIARAS